MDYSSSVNTQIPAIFWLFYLAVIVFYVACVWRVFEKAGEPGWAAIIPIYNIYIMLKIGGKPGWWILLMLIPFVNVVVEIMMLYYLLKAFGREGAGPILLMLFFGFIYWPYLAFSNNVEYVGTNQ